jgi:hypothetical protein
MSKPVAMVEMTIPDRKLRITMIKPCPRQTIPLHGLILAAIVPITNADMQIDNTVIVAYMMV